MRKIFFMALSVLAAVVTGCVKEDLLVRNTAVEEGLPVTATLNFAVEQEKVITRAAQDPYYENRVENMYVLIFDASGNRIDLETSFFTPANGLKVTENGTPDPEKGTSGVFGTVSIEAKTAVGARIAAVANLTTETTRTAYDIDAADLDAVKTLSELESLVMDVSPSIERGALFLMTGFAYNSEGNQSIDIIGSADSSTELKCTLQLRRTDAKVEVIVTSEKPTDKNWTEFAFEPKTWQVLNVPVKSLLLPYSKTGCDGPWDDTEDWDAGRVVADVAENYFSTQESPFEKMDIIESDNTKYYTGGSFVFYMPENRKRYKTEITENDAAKAYALRDDSNTEDFDGSANGKPGQIYENTDFKYANDFSTCLVLTGHLSYIDEKKYNINADVRFIIHLGYATGNANDYDTKRNGHYKYNVKITGVDNIIVEVTNENEGSEVRPGYEGDVVYSNNTIFNLDSHFDRCLLEIPPENVTEQMTWGVKTEFCSGIHAIGSQSFEGVEDYKWIKFAINKKHNTAHGVYVKYPGDQQYKPDADASDPSFDDTGLMDINQLITYLKRVKASDPDMSELIADGFSDGEEPHVCITAFVDENVYVTDPVTGDYNLLLWKTSTDKDDRQMHIIIPFSDGSGIDKDIVYSPDGNSSVVNSLYTFTQRPVRTIYNVNSPDLKTAWGLESVMEAEEGDDNGGRLVPGDVSEGTDQSNGRYNTIQWTVGNKWTDIIETSKRYGLKSGYQTAAYACMLRNRDLDGDDEVDENEVRWYLASIDQLVDIYLGEFALDEVSRLYPRNAADRPGGKSVYCHYSSRSYNPNDNEGQGSPWVLWAEEGASRGSFHNNPGGSPDLNGQLYAYRCVRNLGVALDDITTNPDSLIRVVSNGDGSYILDMSNMNEKALRTNKETTPLPAHNERSETNKPYERFSVTKDVYTDSEDIVDPRNGGRLGAGETGSTLDEAGGNWKNYHNWEFFQNPINNPCPEGYRIPNQRELLIMTTRLAPAQWPSYPVEVSYYVREHWYEIQHQETAEIYVYPPIYISQTAFSLDGTPPYSDQRDGFLWSYDTNVFMLQNKSQDTNEWGYVRCVRDE